MTRPSTIARITLLLSLFLAIAAAATSGMPMDHAPTAVSPGDGSTFSRIGATAPTFSWSLVESATAYELVAYAVREGLDGTPDEDAAWLAEREEPALWVTLPAGVSSWTPPEDLAFAPGLRYVWSVRARIGQEVGPWAESLGFEVAAAPSLADVRSAVQTLERWLRSADQNERGSNARAAIEGDSAKAASPRTHGSNPSLAAKSLIPGTTGLRGEVTDTVGITYGIFGVSHSADGVALAADNAAGGTDLALDGATPALLTESGLSRTSASDTTYDFANPGNGVMTLLVDGLPLFTTANDGTGSGLDADLLDGQHATAFAASSHTHSAVDITTGSLDNGRFSAYSDLSAEGRIDDNSSQDLLQRGQADLRYVEEGQNSSVTSAMLQAGSVTASRIGNGQVQNLQLGGNSVTTDKIANNAVQRADISGTEPAVYVFSGSCGGDTSDQLTTSASAACSTRQCAAGPPIQYYSCAGSCSQSGPQVCSVTLVGYLLDDTIP